MGSFIHNSQWDDAHACSSFSLVQGPHPYSSQGDASASSPAKLKVAPDAQAEPDDLVRTRLEEGGKDCVESSESESSGESEAGVDFDEFLSSCRAYSQQWRCKQCVQAPPLRGTGAMVAFLRIHENAGTRVAVAVSMLGAASEFEWHA